MRLSSQFGIPELVKNLLAINVLMFIMTMVLANKFDLYAILGLHYVEAPGFRPWQFVTHMFMHGGIGHIFFNMFALVMFGSKLEFFWKPKRFFIFYFVAGLGAAAMQTLFTYYQLQTGQLSAYPLTVGASGAIYGLLVAYAMYWPNTELYIMFIPVPIKAKYAIIGLVVLDLFLGVGNFSWDNMAHFAHLGGALLGFIMVKIWNKTNRNSLY
jgi:rhomboid-like protein